MRGTEQAVEHQRRLWQRRELVSIGNTCPAMASGSKNLA
jgi:hypothetical protein